MDVRAWLGEQISESLKIGRRGLARALRPATDGRRLASGLIRMLSSGHSSSTVDVPGNLASQAAPAPPRNDVRGFLELVANGEFDRSSEPAKPRVSVEWLRRS